MIECQHVEWVGLEDLEVGRRYRDTILAPGGTADAADLVERFLGRPTTFDAFEGWLTARA